MAFPAALTNAVDNVTEIVAAHLNNLEAKVGIDGSLVITSLDYLLKNPASINPGHKHSKLCASDGSPDAVMVDDNGYVGVNLATPSTRLHLAETITTSPRGIMSGQYNTGTEGARFHLRKARGSIASPAILVSGDMLGRLVASGYDGSNFLEMAGIDINCEGTLAATRLPTRISFWTATNAAPSVLTERMRITSGGFVGLGTDSPGAKLHIINPSDSDTFIIDQTAGTGYSGFKYRAGGSSKAILGVDIDDGYKFKITAASMSAPWLTIDPTGGNVGIGTTSPNAAALLHMVSTVKGFLPPVMTTVQKAAISSPPSGLVVYDSTLNKLCVYNGSAWETVASAV